MARVRDGLRVGVPDGPPQSDAVVVRDSTVTNNSAMDDCVSNVARSGCATSDNVDIARATEAATCGGNGHGLVLMPWKHIGRSS